MQECLISRWSRGPEGTGQCETITHLPLALCMSNPIEPPTHLKPSRMVFLLVRTTSERDHAPWLLAGRRT
eukprot:1650921-Rhodomonas_salina.5